MVGREMKPWEPRPNESMPAYAAFAEYRDLGPKRSMDAVGKGLGKSLALMERWSARHSWVERAREYDAHLDSIRVAAREQSVAKQARKIMTADEVRAELTEIAEAPWRDFVQVKMKDGQVIEADLKLTEKIKSLELMGRNHKIFTDKVEHSGLFTEAFSKLKAEFADADVSESDLRSWLAGIISGNAQEVEGIQ